MTSDDLTHRPGDKLVIGYGNTLRGDDGVGQGVAEAIEVLDLPGVRTLARHQLTPELADQISQARLVVFVDAAVDIPGNEVRVSSVEPAIEQQVMAHTTSPRGLLELARTVFGFCPPAWLVSVPVKDLKIGERFSPEARLGLAEAVRQVRRLLGS